MKKNADEILTRMRAVRNEMDEDVVDLMEDAKSLLDWKEYVRRFPLVSLAAAGVVGFVLVPAKRKKVNLDARAVKKLLEREKLVVAPSSNVKKSSLGTTIALAVLGPMLRSAVVNFTDTAAASFTANRSGESRSKETSSVDPSRN